VALFLGLDSSTQGLTAMVIEAVGSTRRIVFEHALEFDRDFPVYRTSHGVWRGEHDEVSSSPLMWADALDRMLGIASRARGIDLAQLRAISGSAQQHGSVYLNSSAADVWRTLDSTRPLAEQIRGTFSRASAPVWMDASTGPQCEAIARQLGGREAVAQLTGSAPFERFTGPQIRKFAERHPGAYAQTDRIHLVSSYMASLLAGIHAPIDPGDGAGTNLMDLREGRWAAAALDATAPGLAGRLPALQPSWFVVGRLAPYWQRRYGLPPAQVIAWSGDNPCTLVGAGLVTDRRLGISLGTSDTVLGFTPAPRPSGSGSHHVFGSPTGGFMNLICFSNGSLARERIRDAYGLDWNGFSQALRSSPPGNGRALMLPWFEPEITPHIRVAGVRRRGLDERDAAANVRAVVEAQMMAMANHAADVTGSSPEQIVATGGASVNREILNVMASVFGAEVYPCSRGNTACLGAALRAYHAHELSEGRILSWEEIVEGFTEPDIESRITPVPAHAEMYRELRQEYKGFEDEGIRVVGL
jgi:xylulokinase